MAASELAILFQGPVTDFNTLTFKLNGVVQTFNRNSGESAADASLNLYNYVNDFYSTWYSVSRSNVAGNYRVDIFALVDNVYYNFLASVNTYGGGNSITLSSEILSSLSTLLCTEEHVNNACNGDELGSITLSPSGGVSPYSFAWGDGPGTQNRSLLPAGTYTVIVTDAAAQTVELEIEITEPDPIEATATVEGGDITLVVTGGTAPYTFLWTHDGSTDQNRTDMPPGDYDVQITDANGCMAFANPSVAQYRFFFSDNPIILALAAEDPETKDNLSFICKVYVELEYLSGVFTEVLVMEQPADSEGKTVFDAQTALAAYVEPTLPAVNQNTVTLAGNNFKRFYLKYTEKYGTPPEEATYTQVDMNYVVLGGLSEEEYAANTFFSSYQATKKPFFTWSPTVKNVFKEQPEYLYFMVNSFDLTSFKAKVKVYNTDGTDETFTFHTQTDILKYELYIIPSGHDLLELADIASGTVKAYEVFITDTDDNIISEVKKYKLITDYFPIKRFLMFLNSMGGFDTLSATGKGKMTIDTDEVQADKILPYNHGVSEADFEIISKIGSPSIKVSTGYISSDYSTRLQDFVLSTVYYLFKDERYIPVNIASRNAEIFDEDDTLKSIEFTIDLPKVSKFTPRL